MLRRVMLASVLSLGLAANTFADSMGYQNGQSPYSLSYSASSTPFEAFEWTPLDFAAFSAYGGDFANVRKPVMRITFVEDPFTPPAPAGPDDEQAVVFGFQPYSVPYFESLPQESSLQYQELDAAGPDRDSTIPEPGVLALIGLGLLGASSRLRRAYRSTPE